MTFHLPQTLRTESEQEGSPVPALLHFLTDLTLPFLLISYLPRASPGSSHSFAFSLMPRSPAWSLSHLLLETFQKDHVSTCGSAGVSVDP